MASLIEDLINTLTEEQKIYHELLPLAEEKTRVIINNDLERLQEITAAEQEFVDQVAVLEHKRKDVVVNIGVVMGKKPENLNLKAVAELIEKQPVEHDQVCRLRDDLKRILNRLKSVNVQNQSLIEQSLELVEFNMNVLQADKVAPVNNYSSRAATLDIPLNIRGTFDAKQ